MFFTCRKVKSYHHKMIHISGLDVIRTDRTLVFYEKKENLSKLWDILAVYARIDTDVGYGQGPLLDM